MRKQKREIRNSKEANAKVESLIQSSLEKILEEKNDKEGYHEKRSRL